MTDNKAPEPGQEPTEPQAPPAPAVSEPSDTAPSAPIGVTEDQLKEFGVSLLVQAAKDAQSKHDVRISKFETKMSELEAVVEASGGDWSRVSRDLSENDLRQQVAANTEALASGPGGGTSWEEEWADKSQQMLENAAEKYGVTLTEEEKATFQTMQFETAVDAFGALNDAILAKARGEAIPTAAIASEGAAPASMALGDVDALEANVIRLKTSGATLDERKKALKELTEAQATVS